MLSTTDAIVLSLQPYSDKAHLLHAYTRTGGRVNYMVYGLGKKNTSGKYSPLSVVQLTTDNKSVRTAQLSYVPDTLISDPYKRTIALFISEVLYHVLRHPMPDETMYVFIEQAVRELDRCEAPQNFHIAFLIDFAAQLGFAMQEPPDLPSTRKARQDTLHALCTYFEKHVETWVEPKSLDILIDVFD